MTEKTFSDGVVTPEGTVRFHSMMFFAIAPQGGEWTGYCDLHFTTPDGQPNYATMLSPMGLQSLISDLMSVHSAQPKPPEIKWVQPGGRIIGSLTYGDQTKVYFGQRYRKDVIEALGVLMIRANIVDQALIELNSVLTGISISQSQAQFYSSTNMKARLDAIRSLLSVSELTSTLVTQINDSLDRLKKASDRRNDLVHGRWMFKRNKHVIALYKPNSKIKESELTINETMILDIAESYSLATTLVIANISGVRTHRNAASKTEATPSSTDPSS